MFRVVLLDQLRFSVDSLLKAGRTSRLIIARGKHRVYGTIVEVLVLYTLGPAVQLFSAHQSTELH